MIQPAYRYSAKITRVIDADTFVVNIDLGFCVALNKVKLRVHGWGAPENNTIPGQEATAKVRELFARDPNIIIQSYKDQQSLGRWVADIWVGEYTYPQVMERLGIMGGGF